MTTKQREIKLAKLHERLEALRSKLYEAKCEENRKINNMGWGHAMRHVKCTISTTKSDRIKERIEKCEAQIRELKNIPIRPSCEAKQNKL